MDRETLITLVSAGQQGDADALNRLFNTFYNDVYYFALKTVKDDDLACDITQETFIKVISSLSELKEPAAFVTWMKQITYRECLRYFKKKKEVLVDEDEDGHTVFDTLAEDRAEFIPGEELDQEDFRKTILAMLDELSPEQRAATMLYYYDEMSVKQIAEIQGVSEGTVKSRLNYARKSIKSSVEDYEKKHNIKLHSFGLFPLFIWLFSTEKAMPVAAATIAAQTVSAATGTAIALSSSAAGVGAATAAASTVAGTGILSAVSSVPLAAKIAAGVIAAAVTIGGVTAAAMPDDRNNTLQPTEPTYIQVSATEPVSQTATAVTEPVPTETAPTETEETATEPTEAEATEPTEEVPSEPEPTQTKPSDTEPEETEPAATEPPVTEPAETEPSQTEPESTETEPAESSNLVPAGCTYVTADGTTIGPGEAMPETVSNRDQYITEDYTYTYSGGWSVAVNDNTKSSYAPLLSQINGAPVVSLESTFSTCSNMTVSPAIPGSITNMNSTFWGCHSLTAAPAIPSSVTGLAGTFWSCYSMTTAPQIPSGVTDLSNTFNACHALTTAPIIPEGVQYMGSTFMYCGSLTTAPDIPSSVTSMGATFYGCTALTGTVRIHADPLDYALCFTDTQNPITLTGSSTVLAEIAATSTNGNVAVK